MNDAVSIIVPMYNVENYIEECLRSIAAQDHSNVEIIVIDDGSTDRSGAIADEFSSHDGRFKVVHLASNVGSSSARNIGLEIASGAYIAFVDGDDWIDENFISVMLENVIDGSADICVCDFLSNERPTGNWTAAELSGADIMTAFIAGEIYTRVFNKIYARNVLGDVRFPIGRNLMEDGVWTPKVLLRAKKIRRIVAAPYHYRVRSDGLMRKRRTFREYVGYYMNIVEQYFVLFGGVERATDLRILTVEFIKTVGEFLGSDISNVKEIFMAMKMIAGNFRKKMRPSSAVEKKILQLLSTNGDVETVKKMFSL